MSNNQVVKFYRFLKDKPELLKNIKNNLEESPNQDLNPTFIESKIIPIAQANGFDVTVQNILDVTQ